MNSEEEKKLEGFKNSLEGTIDKQVYDYSTLEFSEYLSKYYSSSDSINNWNSWMNRFVYPAFDKVNRKEFVDYLNRIKPPFFPEFDKLDQFWLNIRSDDRFDEEFKYFFSFQYSCSFFKNISFEDWLISQSWRHPWREDISNERTILEILKYKGGANFLKASLISMPWINRR